jgi:UDP-N-acetylmuramoyl-tripeptide--D-alanyl-D-alanine ligase
LGVPLSILSINDSYELAIIEMGANHKKEIKFLSEMAMPDLGLITNIGKAHLEGFGGLEGVRKGKTELYEYLDATNGTIFYHVEDGMLLKSIPAHTTNISYSIHDAEIITEFPFVGFRYKDTVIQSNLSGTYNMTNIMASLVVGEYFKLSIENLKKGIENYVPNNNRSQIKETKDNVLILDAYNANPTSMAESIKNFSAYPSKNKVLILGHMLELGESSIEEHSELIKLISTFEWKEVYLVGAEFLKLTFELPYRVFLDTDELSGVLKEKKPKGHAILLKGSRGVALEKCIGNL